MNRTGRLVAAVLAAQATLVGVYWLVESGRVSNGVAEGELSTASPSRLEDQVVPPMSLRTRDGNQFILREVERPTLVHFWATWCPPCRVELPTLLALPEDHPVDVVAVALDKDWADVDRFLAHLDRASPSVFLGNAAEIGRELGVRTLPVTFLVGRGTSGLLLRFDGARDWSDRRFVDRWLERVG